MLIGTKELEVHSITYFKLYRKLMIAVKTLYLRI